jgi:hypothetical protein
MDKDDCSPAFEPRPMKHGRGWYVRVFWDFGQEERIAGFATAEEANNWIQQKSKEWLRNRTAALRRT